MALVQIGANADLEDIAEDDGELAELCRLGYPINRDAALREHPWNFALAHQTVPRSGTGDGTGFADKYPLPTNPFCLRVWRLAPSRHGLYPAFAVRGRELYASMGTSCTLDYIARIENEALFDAMFAEVLSLRLGWWLAPKISGHRTVQGQIWELYQTMLRNARSADGQEGRERQDEGEFMGARR